MRDSIAWYEDSSDTPTLALLSIPFELGSDARGLAAAPSYLVEQGLERMFDSIGVRIASRADMACPQASGNPGFPKFLPETADVAVASAAAVSAARQRGETVVALCGDHASAIGTIKGAAAHERIGLIYIDAHPDIHTHESTVSGNTHAMVVSSALGWGDPRLGSIGGTIRGEDILYIGLKDFDTAEFEHIRKSGASVATALDIALRGLGDVCEKVDLLRSRVESVWVSMDLDSIDRADAPGVAMPSPDGLSRREVLALAHYIGKSCTLAGMDVVEILPKNDSNGRTAGLALELVARFLGKEFTWYRSYMQPYEIGRAIAETPKTIKKRTYRGAKRPSARQSS